MVVGSSDPSTFIIDLRSSQHMASVIEIFNSMYLNSGPVVRMGDDSEIQAKEVGRIDLEHGYFSDVLYVPDLEAIFSSFYQMTHKGESKRVTFTPDLIEIG